MSRFFLYPLNIYFLFLLCFSLSFLNFSYFYTPATIGDGFILIYPFFIYIIFYFLLRLFNHDFLIDYSVKNNNIYKFFLFFSLLGFVVEFMLKGIPIMQFGGRDDYVGIPFLHVIFYSSIVCSVLFSSLYSSKRSLAICMIFSTIISILILSRQLLVVSFLIVTISSFLRYKISGKVFAKVLVSIVIVVFFFGVLGDFRQKLSGDYVDDYILSIGGANTTGSGLGSSLYWLWLYVTSPIYNLLYNINVYNSLGGVCSAQPLNCSDYVVSSYFIPDTISKYWGLEFVKIKLIQEHLNVGTGFSSVAIIAGLTGVMFQIILQFIYYLVGLVFVPKNVEYAYKVFFSALSFLMVFDNLYVRGEFFFCFVLIYIAGFLNKISSRI